MPCRVDHVEDESSGRIDDDENIVDVVEDISDSILLKQIRKEDFCHV